MEEELLKLIDLSEILANTVSGMISKFGKCPECGESDPHFHRGNCNIGIAVFDALWVAANKEDYIKIAMRERKNESNISVDI